MSQFEEFIRSSNGETFVVIVMILMVMTIHDFFSYKNVKVDGCVASRDVVKKIKRSKLYIKYTLSVLLSHILLLFFAFLPSCMSINSVWTAFVSFVPFLVFLIGRRSLCCWIVWRCPCCGKLLSNSIDVGYQYIVMRPEFVTGCLQCGGSVFGD